MGDSDDDYESNMNKRRGQSRNKFRNERDDLLKPNMSGNNGGDLSNDLGGNSAELKRKEREYSSNSMYGSGKQPYNNTNNNNSRQPQGFDADYNNDDFRNSYGRPSFPNNRYF